MFIICKNDFPWSACPVGTDRELAERIAGEHQKTCGVQIGLADKTYFHIVEVPITSAVLIKRIKELKQENNDDT